MDDAFWLFGGYAGLGTYFSDVWVLPLADEVASLPPAAPPPQRPAFGSEPCAPETPPPPPALADMC